MVPVWIWRQCRKPEVGGFSTAPADLDTAEIREVCQVYETPLTPELHRRIRHLHGAWRGELIDQADKKSKSRNNK